MRFYSFVAQVVSLGDTGPETLFLCRLADPALAQSAGACRHQDHRRHDAAARFKNEQKEAGSASLAAGDDAALADQGIRRAATVAAFPSLAVLVRTRLLPVMARTETWRGRIGHFLEIGAALAATRGVPTYLHR